MASHFKASDIPVVDSKANTVITAKLTRNGLSIFEINLAR